MARVNGIWLFNDVLTMPSETIRQAINFEYKGGSLSTGWSTGQGDYLTFDAENSFLVYSKVVYGTEYTNVVYSSAGWYNSHQQTRYIYFTESQEVSDEFYAALIANATKVTTLVDLTGTTWVFDTTKPLNSLMSVDDASGIAFTLDYTVTSRNMYGDIETCESNDAYPYFGVGNTYVRVANGNGGGSDVYTATNEDDPWNGVDKGLRIAIHGGYSALDPTLIAWFEQNAIQTDIDDPEYFGDFDFEEEEVSGINYWSDKALRNIAFTEEQEVSASFYAWLTANADPVSDEYGNADTPTVKGEWKFKNELTSESTITEKVNFTTRRTVFSGGVQTVVPFECWLMVVMPTSMNSQLNYHYTSEGGGSFVAYTKPSSESSGGEGDEGGEVDTPTQEPKKLSGVWEFNEVLTQRDYLTEDINFKAYRAILVDGERILVTYNCYAFFLYPPMAGNRLHYYYGAVSPELPDINLNYDTGVNFEAYSTLSASGEYWTNNTLKTIEFTEEQTVSDEFYEWFVANAAKTSKTIGGTWVWNDDTFESYVTAEDFDKNDVAVLEKVYNEYGVSVQPATLDLTEVVGEETIVTLEGITPRLLYSAGEGATTFVAKAQINGDNTFTTVEDELLLNYYPKVAFNGDQEVSAEVYDWFATNATLEVVEPEEPVSRTIKAGTYRFNDVLDTTYYADADINFTVSGYIAEYGVEVVAHFNRINNGYIAADDIEMSYRLVSTTPNLGVEGGFDIVDIAAGSDDGWRNEMWQINLQTITIPTDSEVSAEFYAWFIANAVEVVEEDKKYLSGKWRFNDIIIPPSEVFEQAVTFTCHAYSEMYESYNDTMVISLVEWPGTSRDYIYYTYTFPEYPGINPTRAIVYRGYNGWGVGVYCGESLQNIDFGTEPQEVSAVFYEWFMANAVKIENPKRLVGRWRFKDTLTAPSVRISQPINFRLMNKEIGSSNVTGDFFVVSLYDDDVNMDLEYRSQNASFAGLTIVYSTLDGWKYADADFDIQTIIFTEEQEVSDNFYEWFTANAVFVGEGETDEPTEPDTPEPDTTDAGAIISYNGKVIFAPKAGQTATLFCKGKKLENDVVVEVAEQSGGGGVVVLQNCTDLSIHTMPHIGAIKCIKNGKLTYAPFLPSATQSFSGETIAKIKTYVQNAANDEDAWYAYARMMNENYGLKYPQPDMVRVYTKGATYYGTPSAYFVAGIDCATGKNVDFTLAPVYFPAFKAKVVLYNRNLMTIVVSEIDNPAIQFDEISGTVGGSGVYGVNGRWVEFTISKSTDDIVLAIEIEYPKYDITINSTKPDSELVYSLNDSLSFTGIANGFKHSQLEHVIFWNKSGTVINIGTTEGGTEVGTIAPGTKYVAVPEANGTWYIS